ncbi:MAG: hypothetical protein ABMA14_15560 [Hyphomonadaceae bacterium]
MLLWTLEFTTDKFRPFLPEPCQVNEDLYGFELAAWLAEALAEADVVTGYPHAEEWGWFVEYMAESQQEIMIGCASHGPTQGFPTQWRIFARQRRKPLKGGTDAAELLCAATLSVLAAEGIEARKL